LGGSCSTNGERIDVYRFLVKNCKGKRPLGKSTLTRVYNIKTNLQEEEWVHGLD
jgi:hypothetical protein